MPGWLYLVMILCGNVDLRLDAKGEIVIGQGG